MDLRTGAKKAFAPRANATGQLCSLFAEDAPPSDTRGSRHSAVKLCAEADVPNVPVSISCTSSAPVVLVLAAAPSSSSDRLFEKLQ